MNQTWTRTEKLASNLVRKNAGMQKLCFIYHRIHVKGKRGILNTSQVVIVPFQRIL